MRADNDLAKSSEIDLRDLSGHELIKQWRAGSQEAAALLMDRYRLRLIALIASRISRRQRGSIDPEDVVQSALASFFKNTGIESVASPNRLQIESTLSVWNLLAMFARRKLSRSLERATTAKRGAGWDRAPMDAMELFDFQHATPDSQDVSELVAELNGMLEPDQVALLDLLLAGNNQHQIAEQLHVDERTVRRRVANLRSLLAPHLIEPLITNNEKPRPLLAEISLPRVGYGQFVLGKMIGSGGFGKVYQARMQATDAMIAVKFMHRHWWTDPRAKISFLLEIDQASRINHPGIIKYLGWGDSPHGGPYILSELIDGKPLAAYRNMDEVQLVQILQQVCEAVRAAHLSGVVHGDLTPNNILVTSDGRAIVTDFGLSTCTQPIEPLQDDNSCERAIGGTLGYAAPEQVSSVFGTIGPWTDIYAIGALAYFCITGVAPHGRADATASLASTIADEDEKLPVRLTSNMDSLKLSNLVATAMRKVVADRPGDIGALQTILN